MVQGEQEVRAIESRSLVLGIVGFILLSIGIVCVAASPITYDDAVATRVGEAVKVLLRVSDGDINPLQPNGHPIAIEVLEGPVHGTLEGSLQVSYYAPHLAVVELVYTPMAGYQGADRISFAATDPTGASDIGEISINVRSSVISSLELLGDWSFYATYDDVTAPVANLITWFSATADWGDFDLKASGSISGLGFTDLDFTSHASFDDILMLTSVLSFNPSTPAFDSFSAIASFRLSNVGCDVSFFLPDSPDDMYVQVRASGQIDGVSVANTLKLGGCDLGFETNQLLVSWRWSTCEARVSGALTTSCEDGFDSFLLSVKDFPLEIALFPLLELDVDLRYTLDGKSMDLDVSCEDLYIDCFKFYCDISGDDAQTDAFDLGTFSIYGIEVRCSIPPNVTFSSVTSLSPDWNAAVTGDADFFELVTLSGTIVSCCGLSSVWQAQSFFKPGAASLFDVAQIKMSADILFAESFLVSSGLTYKISAGGLSWVVGFEISW